MIQVICMQENNRSQKQKIQISIIIAITMKEKIKPRKGEDLKSMSEIKMKWDCGKDLQVYSFVLKMA